MKKRFILFMVMILTILPLNVSAQSKEQLKELSVTRNKELLSTFGINSDNHNIANIVKTDDANEIIHISNFKDLYSSNRKNIAETNNKKLYVIIDKIKEYYKLDKKYKLVQNKQIEEDYYQLIWQKELKENVFNPYDSIQVIVNANDLSISSLVKFTMQIDMVDTIVTEEQAKENAFSFFNDYRIIKSDIEAQLTTFRPNYYWDNNKIKKDANFIRLAYKVQDYNNTLAVYIDAITGDNLGGGVSLSISNDSAGCFGAGTLSYSTQLTDLAYDGMENLGYSNNTKLVEYATLGESIKNFWKDDNSYAFYVTCHGNYDVIGDDKGEDELWALYPRDVSGNWKFVFLDACKTALNDTWTTAFNITNSSSNRAFLGWTDTVKDSNSHLFSQQFWSKLDGKKTIYNAAVEAANAVPGTGTTPIKFYGDKSYTGKVN